MSFLRAAVMAPLLSAAAPAFVVDEAGQKLFERRCENCHRGAVSKAPQVSFLRMMMPDAIMTAMQVGVMQLQAAALGPEQRARIAAYLTGRKLGQSAAAAKSGVVTAVDPDRSGKRLWSCRVGRGCIQDGVHLRMAAEGTRVYVPVSDVGEDSLGRRIREPGGVGLHAEDARTEMLLWSAPAVDRCRGRAFCDPGCTAAATAIPAVVFAFALDGWLRAFDCSTGNVLREVNARIPVAAVNGATAQGGSLSGPGVLVVDGYVVTNSGYGFAGHMLGNALLVYGLCDDGFPVCRCVCGQAVPRP